MSSPIIVPTVPALARIPNVELMHTGTWQLSTGPATFTTEDLTDAVSALGCSAVRRPVLKIGHSDPRFDGEPCVGYIDNLAVADGGRTLTGDYAGLPSWLGDVLASAYPDRSIEGEYNYRCQMGHIHPYVVHAVALLGVTHPGIGTLASLQDIASLYGVVAKSGQSIPMSKVGKVTDNPYARRVAATVTAEDVMRAFYDSETGSSWDAWVEELQLDPLQLIYVNDKDNSRSRVSVTIGAGEGKDAVSFSDPVPVLVRYVDAAVSLPTDSVRFAYRASRQTSTGRPGVDLTDDQLNTMRTTLNLPADAGLDQIIAAMSAPPNPDPGPDPGPPPTPPTPSPAPQPSATLPDGTVALDKVQFETLVAAAKRGDEARARQEDEDRHKLVHAAIADGRIPPARRDAWVAQLKADPGSATILAALSPGLIPVTSEIGHGGGPATDDDALYARLFGAPEGTESALRGSPSNG